jgi:hypothetical protein
MKVLVFGANGRTGGLVVAHAIAIGHDVSVLVRLKGRSYSTGVRVIEGDALNARGCVARYGTPRCCSGVHWRNGSMATSDVGTRRDAKHRGCNERVRHSAAVGCVWARCCREHEAVPVVVPVPGGADLLAWDHRDKKAMEGIVRGRELDWVIARAPILTDEDGIGRVKVLGKSEKGRAITRVDLAAWLVNQLESRIYVGQAVAMVNN